MFNINPKELTFSNDARNKMLKGIDILANAVKVTLGPKGRLVVMETMRSPRATKDGVTVAKEIVLMDRIENMGAQLLRQIAIKTSDIAGDGTTTATVLGQELVHEGIKCVTAGMNPMSLKRGIDLAISEVVKHLKENSKEISSKEEISQIGTISANGDKSIGDMLAEAVSIVGKDGLVSVQEGKTPHTTLEIVDGMQFNQGFISPYFITNHAKNMCEFKNPLILIYDKKLSSLNHMAEIVSLALATQRPLVIIAEDVEAEALSTLIINKNKANYSICAIRSPGFGETSLTYLEDIAAATGGTLICEENGTRLSSTTLDMLGSCEFMKISSNHTVIIKGNAKPEIIEARQQQIRAKLAEEIDPYEIDILKNRLAKLTTGIAVIKVGAITETECKEKRDRVEDSMHATQAAISEGIVPGGGVALIRAIVALKDLKGKTPEEDAGIRIVRQVLTAPCKQIVTNCGEDGLSVVSEIIKNDSYSFGYDAENSRYVDMIKEGIIDPTKVVRTALEDAASIAGIIITTEAIIAEHPATEQLNFITSMYNSSHIINRVPHD